MSIPNQEIVFGKIEFKGKIYNSLFQELSDMQFDKIINLKMRSINLNFDDRYYEDIKGIKNRMENII